MLNDSDKKSAKRIADDIFSMIDEIPVKISRYNDVGICREK